MAGPGMPPRPVSGLGPTRRAAHLDLRLDRVSLVGRFVTNLNEQLDLARSSFGRIFAPSLVRIVLLHDAEVAGGHGPEVGQRRH